MGDLGGRESEREDNTSGLLVVSENSRYNDGNICDWMWGVSSGAHQFYW